MKQLLIATLILLAFSGCGSGRITSLEKEQNEAIVFGKLTIMDNGKDVSQKSNILFDERSWATYVVVPDENNYFYIKLPLGKHFIAFVQSSSYNKSVPDNYAEIEVKESKIYYIGDLTMNFKFGTADESRAGIVGAAIDINKKGELIPIEIRDNYDSTSHYFMQKFGNVATIQKSILRLNK